MDVNHFDWDEESNEKGNRRHVQSTGYDPEDIEEAILDHQGPVGLTRKSRRPMIRAAMANGEDIIIVFEIDAIDDFVVVRPVTAFPMED